MPSDPNDGGGADGGEEALIAEYWAPLAAGLPGALGLKDDCALIAPPPGTRAGGHDGWRHRRRAFLRRRRSGRSGLEGVGGQRLGPHRQRRHPACVPDEHCAARRARPRVAQELRRRSRCCAGGIRLPSRRRRHRSHAGAPQRDHHRLRHLSRPARMVRRSTARAGDASLRLRHHRRCHARPRAPPRPGAARPLCGLNAGDVQHARREIFPAAPAASHSSTRCARAPRRRWTSPTA